jgi:phosphoglycolate phosphatase
MLAAGQIKAVIIDLDGTLLHTLPDLVAGANGMLCTMGFSPLPADQIGTFVGKGAANLVLRCLQSYLTPEQSQAMHARALAVFEREYHAVNGEFAELFPGVIEGLEAFKAKGLRMAVVTNKPCQFAFPLLDAKGLTPYFELVLGGDSLPQRKPDPAPLLHVAEKFGLRPEEVLAIGDSSNDAQAARAAGMPVFLVPYGYNHGEPIDQSPSDGIVSSIAQAAQRIA